MYPELLQSCLSYYFAKEVMFTVLYVCLFNTFQQLWGCWRVSVLFSWQSFTSVFPGFLYLCLVRIKTSLHWKNSDEINTEFIIWVEQLSSIFNKNLICPFKSLYLEQFNKAIKAYKASHHFYYQRFSNLEWNTSMLTERDKESETQKRSQKSQKKRWMR